MNNINELKEKLEELRNAKVDIDNEIVELSKESDVSSIEKEIANLNLTALDIKKDKVYRVLSIIVLVVSSVVCTLSPLLAIPSIEQWSLSRVIVLLSSMLVMGGLGLGVAMLGMAPFPPSIKKSNKMLFEIQDKIRDKEKEKEIVKQSSKTNEQKLVLLNEKRAEICSEIQNIIQNIEGKLSTYETVKSQEIEKIVSSSLSKIETKVFDDDMVSEETRVSKGKQIIKHL